MPAFNPTLISDLIGKQFGRLTVIGGIDGDRRRVVCRCNCGSGVEKPITIHDLRVGKSTSCGCVHKERASEANHKYGDELIGQRFGRLLIVALGPYRRWKLFVRTRCDCGDEQSVPFNALRTGNTRSCGCLQREAISAATTVHGFRKIPEYQVWRNMVRRCADPANPHYGGREGRPIKVCDTWLIGEDGKHPFECFLEDMGPRPAGKAREWSIERANGNGDYEPLNCFWAPVLVQANNRSNSRRINYRGESMTFAQAVRRAGSVVPYDVAYHRWKNGWPLERAIGEAA